MRAKSTIQIGVTSSIVSLLLAAPGAVQAQGRHLNHTVSVQVPTIVRMVPDPVAVGPNGLPIYRVVTNDPVLRRRLERGAEGGLVAEALVAAPGRSAESKGDFRFTVVAP
jgi:hypothetical protein